MAKFNPLLRSQLPPVGEDGTQSDIAARLRNPSFLLKNITNQPIVQRLKPKQHRSSAKVSLPLSQEDKLADDFVEGKESYETLIYSIFKQDPKLISTLVESKAQADIQSGKFDHILNNRLVVSQIKQEYKPTSDIDLEMGVYEKLYHWSGRLQKLFMMIQGFLAGFAMLHLYLIFCNDDRQKLVGVYAEISRVVSTILQSLVMLALLGSMHTLIAERRHCNLHIDRHISTTQLEFDTEKHRAPYYVALFCTVCEVYSGYGICYLLSTLSSAFVNEIYYENQRDVTWADGNYSSSFESRMDIWTYLSALECIVRCKQLAIIVWFLICSQSNWNTGSLYLMKLQGKEDDMLTLADEDAPTEVYQHLFYGNPYLPTGVYEIAKSV